MNNSFSYCAYGLGIKSCIPFLELQEEEVIEQSVEIKFGKVNGLTGEATLKSNNFSANRDEILFFLEDAGSFFIQKGMNIIIDPISGVKENVLRNYILGASLAMLLYQRDYLILHASTVMIGNNCVSFLGSSGWGKSTLAATLCAKGHRLISDDVCAINLNKDLPKVYPAAPQIKLCLDAANFIKNDLNGFEILENVFDKIPYLVKNKFSKEPIPLKHIYVLTDDDKEEIYPLALQETLVELIRHTYRIQMITSLDPSSHFLKCVNLAKAVPVSLLKRRRDLELLPKLVDMLERDHMALYV